MGRELNPFCDGLYIDDQRNIYFCPGEFCRLHGFPNTEDMRYVVAEDMKDLIPGLIIVEEELN
jgi:hypothetical protein